MVIIRGIATKVALAVALTVGLGFALLAFSLHRTARQHMQENAERVVQLWHQLALLSTLLTMVVTAVVFVLLKRLVGRPVRQLVEGTRRLASGDLHQPIVVHSRDEIGELATSFNETTEELAKAQHKLAEMERLASVGRLAAGVAHEINNPLTGILTYAESLQDDLEPPLRSDVDAIIGETLRCREIVRRLLDFARHRPPTKRPTDLNELVLRVTGLLERQTALAHVNVRRELGETVPTVLVDANQIHQVIVNLVVNAAEAMPEGGTVTVRTEPSGNAAALLHVKDTGAGIPTEVQTHLFDPFFTTKPLGTGLGLPVVWGIVQQHKGRLSFVTRTGEGTTFSVELPTEDAGEGA